MLPRLARKITGWSETQRLQDFNKDIIEVNFVMATFNEFIYKNATINSKWNELQI